MNVRSIVASVLGVILAVGAMGLGSRGPDDGNLIRNPDFNAGSDGWLNQDRGRPAGVVTEWLADAGRPDEAGKATGGVHIRIDEQDSKHLQIWRVSLDGPPVGKRVKFSAWVKGRGVKNLAAVCVRAEQEGEDEVVNFGTTQTEQPMSGDFDWTLIESTIDVPAGTTVVQLLAFLVGPGEVWYDDISARVVGDAKPVKPRPAKAAPGLLEILTAARVQAKPWGSEAVLLLPMPLSYRDQAPVTYELKVTPAEAAASCTVYEDRPGNYVAKLTLKEIGEHGPIDIAVRSVVLAGRSDFESVPATAAIPSEWPEEARPWLASTWCVESGDERFVAIGKEIREGTEDVMEIIRRTLDKGREVMEGQSGRCGTLIAVEALEREGSCTSAANLVAALLRSSGVPARVLAGYPAWSGPLQTHYIVEAYVPGFGWYPIESTMLRAPWPNHEQINVQIVPPEYEAKERARTRFSAMGGVPYLSLTEYPNYRFGFSATGTIEDAPYCDHVCKMVRSLKGSPDEWAGAMGKARASWSAWLGSGPGLGADGRMVFGPAADALTAKSPAELASQIAP